MKKIVLVGDLHMRAKRLADVAGSWKWAVKWAQDNGADLIAQAGDVFDHYNVYGREASTGTIYAEFLHPITSLERRVPIVAIVGNHDMGGPHDADALVPLDKFADVKTYRKPQIVEPIPGVSICMLPWVNKAHLLARLIKGGMDTKPATDKVNEAMSKLSSNMAKAVADHKHRGNFVLFMGHLEVTGAKMAGGMAQSDGSFEYAPLDLCDLGCHAYALAHIHIRQHVPGLPNPNDGYLGGLCQLNFGDGGNPAGFRVIEVEGNRLVSDAFVENDTAPRYFTVPAIEDAKCRDGDYVKVRGHVKPECLPEGVVFEKIPVAKESRRRIEDKVDAEDSLEKLLKAWVDQQPSYGGPPLKDLAEAAECLLKSAAKPPMDAIGSLDSIDRITLKHIASHDDTTVDLSDVKSVCAIEGPTGVGKTTLMEGIMLALYGGTPGKPSLHHWVTRKYVGDAMIEVAFSSGGRKYVARREMRKTTKTFSHKAYLFDSEHAEAIAGPKIEDVYSKCCELVGDPDMVWAGTFSSQDDVGNLMDVEPSERKKLFAKLLGTERLLFISELARKALNAEAAIFQSNRSAVNRLREESSSEEEVSAAIARVKGVMAGRDGVIASTEGTLERAKAELAEVAAKAAECERMRARAAGLTAKKAEVQARGRTLKAQKDAISSIDVASMASELKSKMTLRDAARVALRREEDEVGAAKKPVEEDLRKLHVDYKLTQSFVDDAKRRAALLSGFPDEDVCRLCPLAKDGIAGRDDIPKLKKKADELGAALDAKKAEAGRLEKEWVLIQERKASVEAMDRQIESMAQAHADAMTRKASADVIEAQLVGLRNEFSAAEAELKGIVAPEPVDDAPIRGAIERLVLTISKLRDGNTADARELGRHEAALEAMGKKKAEAAALQEKLDASDKAIAVYDAIANAFGRDGVPQYIVDGAIPRFEEAMAELLKEFRWSISVSSQKATKKGTVQEVIDIMIDDGDGDRELFTYSGGEKKILKGIVRLAFSTLQAERSGKGIKVLVFDEATDAMDGEIAHVFVRMLSRASSAFKQVFIISHEDHVLTSIPRRLMLSPSPTGTKVMKST